MNKVLLYFFSKELMGELSIHIRRNKYNSWTNISKYSATHYDLLKADFLTADTVDIDLNNSMELYILNND